MTWNLRIYLDPEKTREIFNEEFDTIKQITDYLPFFKKDMLYNIRNRNSGKWNKNTEIYSRITLDKI